MPECMNEQRPILVTVITCFYNEEAYLAEAVKSVLAQKYTHWELMLVDDGSTDNSTAMAKNYASAHPEKIFYLDHVGHENKGLSASRNLGISFAKGSMLCFLDADDVYFPEKINKQLEILTLNPAADMVMEATSYWYNWNNPLLENPIIPIGTKENQLYHPPALMLALYPLGNGQAPCTSSFMVRKTAVEKVGGFEASFNGPMQLYEDQGFFSKMYLSSRIFISPECNSQYRQRQESIVYRVKSEGHYDEVRKFYLRWLQQYLTVSGFKFPEVSEKIKQAFFRLDHPRIFWWTSHFKKKLKAIIRK
jgi:glycosyltransferase involved in cell wall biosynthesis